MLTRRSMLRGSTATLAARLTLPLIPVAAGEPTKIASQNEPETAMPIRYLGLPTIKVARADAVETIAHIRREGAAAIIIGQNSDEERIRQRPDYPDEIIGRNPKTGEAVSLGPVPTPAEVLRKADAIDTERWFAQRRERHAEDLKPEASLGQWHAGAVWQQRQDMASGFSLDMLYILHRRDGSLTRHEPDPDVFIARLPTADANEAPAYLRFGGWNEAPRPAEQVAIARHWSRRWEARIIAIHMDFAEYEVVSPPNTHEEAVALAHEQFFYCSEGGSIRERAPNLVGAHHWFFWWD
jgi:hypothetical protein